MPETFFSQHRRLLTIAAALVILAVLGAAIVWQYYFRSPSDGGTFVPPSATTTPPVLPPAAGMPPPPSAPAYTGLPVQALNPSADILKQVPADTYEKSRKELVEFAVLLAANPQDASGWMRVAYIKRFYGDYAGTRDAYEY